MWIVENKSSQLKQLFGQNGLKHKCYLTCILYVTFSNIQTCMAWCQRSNQAPWFYELCSFINITSISCTSFQLYFVGVRGIIGNFECQWTNYTPFDILLIVSFLFTLDGGQENGPHNYVQ